MSKRWIELSPRFICKDGDSYFSGYNQTDGTHFYDNVGCKYRFVPEGDFDKLREERDRYKSALEKIRDNPSAETTDGQEWKHVKIAREALQENRE